MIKDIISFIDNNSLIKSHSTIVVGLSGGPDSVCLLHILDRIKDRYKIKIVAAYFNHQWRSEQEIIADINLCNNLCKKLNIELFIGSADQINPNSGSIKYNGSKEDLARKMRRRFLEKVLLDSSASSIALAQHTDDQLETFMIRLIRGANLSGLSGIKPKNGLYIRPLLNISKKKIYAYLDDQKLEFITDSTNKDNKYLRNRVRNNILPEISQADPRFNINCLKAISFISEADRFIARTVSKILSEISLDIDNIIFLNIQRLFNQDVYLHKAILLEWLLLAKAPISSYLSSSFLEEILRFLPTSAKRHVITTNLTIIKTTLNNQKHIYILP